MSQPSPGRARASYRARLIFPARLKTRGGGAPRRLRRRRRRRTPLAARRRRRPPPPAGPAPPRAPRPQLTSLSITLHPPAPPFPLSLPHPIQCINASIPSFRGGLLPRPRSTPRVGAIRALGRKALEGVVLPAAWCAPLRVRPVSRRAAECKARPVEEGGRCAACTHVRSIRLENETKSNATKRVISNRKGAAAPAPTRRLDQNRK